jgi:hypothetical protein
MLILLRTSGFLGFLRVLATYLVWIRVISSDDSV